VKVERSKKQSRTKRALRLAEDVGGYPTPGVFGKEAGSY
jgi:hypothetical protein